MTRNESGYPHFSSSGLESALNTDWVNVKPEMEEVSEGHNDNQDCRDPPKFGLFSKIQRMFGWTDEDRTETKQGRRVCLSMMFH